MVNAVVLGREAVRMANVTRISFTDLYNYGQINSNALVHSQNTQTLAKL